MAFIEYIRTDHTGNSCRLFAIEKIEQHLSARNYNRNEKIVTEEFIVRILKYKAVRHKSMGLSL